MLIRYQEIKQFIEQIEDDEITDLELSARKNRSVEYLTAKISDLENYKIIAV